MRVQEEDERWDSIRTVVRVAEAGRLAVAVVADREDGLRLPVDRPRRVALLLSRPRRVASGRLRLRVERSVRLPRSRGSVRLRLRKAASALRRAASALLRLVALELRRRVASALRRETWEWSPRAEDSALRA